MHGHISIGFFHCDVLFLQGKCSGFRYIVANVKSEFFEYVANFDHTSKSIKMCYLFKKFT